MIYPSVHNCTGQEDSLCDCPTVVRHCISAMVVALQCHPPGKLKFIKMIFLLTSLAINAKVKFIHFSL